MLKKVHFLSLIFLILSGVVSFGQSPDSNEVVNNAFNNMSADLFKNYENDKKEKIETGSVTLHWQSNTNNDVVVRYRKDGTDEWNYSPKFSSKELSYEITNLEENNFFEWQIGNEGNWSALAEFHSLGIHLFKNLAAKGGAESAKLTWSID